MHTWSFLTLAVFLACIVVLSANDETADYVEQSSNCSTASRSGRSVCASDPSSGCCTCQKSDCSCCNNKSKCARKEHPMTVLTTGTYYFSDFSTTWLEAMQYCNKLDMDLATFETNHEMDVVLYYIHHHEDNPFPWRWVGLHVFNRPGDYRWISNNGLLDPDVAWISGQPDEYNYTRLCGDISVEWEGLDLWYCDETIEDQFICEARC